MFKSYTNGKTIGKKLWYTTEMNQIGLFCI